MAKIRQMKNASKVKEMPFAMPLAGIRCCVCI
jgi:hypothetical protein